MKKYGISFLTIALVIIVGVTMTSTTAYSAAPFDKDFINSKLSCVGIQLLDSGKLELQSPSEGAREAFYRLHGADLQAIINAVQTLGSSYDGQCTHRNTTNSGNWIPVCRLK
jgi:hypothetical protein